MSYQPSPDLGRPPGAMQARANNSPASLSADLFVVVPRWQPFPVGPVPWVAKKSGALPVKDDQCLVVFDELGLPWVTGWR